MSAHKFEQMKIEVSEEDKMIDYELLKQTRVVLIADLADNFSSLSLDDLHLEMTTHETYKLIMKSLQTLCKESFFYSNPRDFMNHIGEHKNDVVLSIWSGINSRNRKALVPSICEANGICYVGADAYVHIICQDKKLTKEFCEPYGILGARDVLIRSETDISQLAYLQYPIVIKPNYEGGSIGISNSNLVHNFTDAQALTRKLLSIYEAILAEEYIQGYEVCVCISGVLGGIDVFEGVQSNFGNQEYITTEIYGYEYKKYPQAIKSKEKATDKILPQVKEQLLNLYWGLGKVEVMRIDGRIDHQGQFHLIELSPDCSLAPNASTATSYYYSGRTFQEMIAELLTNAIINQECQNAKK